MNNKAHIPNLTYIRPGTIIVCSTTHFVKHEMSSVQYEIKKHVLII